MEFYSQVSHLFGEETLRNGLGSTVALLQQGLQDGSLHFITVFEGMAQCRILCF